MKFEYLQGRMKRLSDLAADALKEYDKQLADAAHPLEEKAIAVHEKNLELMRRGLNNAWTQKSLDRLAALRPDTYARTEISSGFLGSLERYVYQPPPRAPEAVVSPPAAPAVATAPTVSAAPTAAQSATGAESAAASASASEPATTPGSADSAIGQALTAGAGNANPH